MIKESAFKEKRAPNSRMEQRGIGRQITPHCLTILFAVISFLLFLPFYLTPWVGGVDPITRLANIDDIIVVVLGNPWLPATQILVQLVQNISDTAITYKLVIGLVAASAVFLTLLLLHRFLGMWGMLFGWLFFILSDQWQMVATSVYMEPLALFFLSASVYFFSSGRSKVGKVLFVGGTFTRPEFLISAPAILAVHFLFFKNWRRSIRFGMLFLPISIYYLIIKSILPGFESSGQFDWGISSLLLYKLFMGYEYRLVFQLSAVLALFGLFTLLLDPNFLAGKVRKFLLLLPLGIALFVLIFVVFTPLAHGYCPGGTRHTLLITLPVWLYAAIFVSYFSNHYPKIGPALLMLMVMVALPVRFSNFKPKQPHYFAAIQELIAALKLKLPAGRNQIYLCNLDDSQLNGDDVHMLDRNPIKLYLRFADLKLRPIDCGIEDDTWRDMIRENHTPLLRIYLPAGLTKKYELLLTEECRYFKKIFKGGRLVAEICF